MELTITCGPKGEAQASLTLTTPEGRIRLSGSTTDIEKALAHAVNHAGLTPLRRYGIFADRLNKT